MITTLVIAQAAFGQCRTQAYLDALKPVSGVAAFVVDASRSKSFESMAAIRKAGGHVLLFGDRLILARIDPSADRDLIMNGGIGAIHRGSRPLAGIAPGLFQSKRDAPLARFFDRIMNGTLEAIIQKGLDTPPGPPLTGDVGSYASVHKESQPEARTAVETKTTRPPLRSPGQVSGLSSTAPPWTFAKMEGDFVVTVFEMEKQRRDRSR